MRISDWSSDVCSSDLAAESFAYTLQQAGRATIVGEASGGAANPGAPVATREGLAVFVPTGSPVNPFSGGNWEGTGVQPDVRVPSAEAFDAALRLARAAAVPGRPEYVKAASWRRSSAWDAANAGAHARAHGPLPLD